MKILLIVLALTMGCSTGERETITFWHFWSEPSQRDALTDLIRQYERDHDVHVELTDLAWSDGKAKLQLAFNAGTAPDIVHLGLDWEEEFRASGVFASVKGADSAFRRLWVVNARALAVWTGPTPTYNVGLCKNDNHNVLKRTLPMIWQAGAPQFYTSTPISAGMDSTLTQALWEVHRMAMNNAVIDRSRTLDEMFLRGEIRKLYTGPWIVDMARRQHVTTFTIQPSVSILNGDVLVVTAASTNKERAASLIDWLTSHEQARSFCLKVSDAGFPASVDSTDKAFIDDPLQRGFLRTVAKSRPLPTSPLLLRIEPIIEDLIVRSYDAARKEDIAAAVAESRQRIEVIERER